MDKRKNAYSALILGLSHFIVDFSCTALLTLLSKASAADTLLLALLYNALAFAFQLPLGALADKLALTRSLSLLGCLFVALGVIIPKPFLAAFLLGLGNACFHIGGGRESLKRGGEKAAQIGKFVAPGALGIFLGPLCASRFPQIRLFLLLPLVLCMGLLLFLIREDRAVETRTLPSHAIGKASLFLIICSMFITVLLRSYMGTLLRYEFQSDPICSFLFVLCIFAGKFFGGSLADRFAPLPFSAFSQFLCTILFTLSVFFPFCALPAIFLFNTSMAVTACALYRCFPAWSGAMFGLTTFALFLGALPRLLGLENQLFSWWGLLLLGTCSAVTLLAGLRLMRKKENHVG